jgi:hypothetical protein
MPQDPVVRAKFVCMSKEERAAQVLEDAETGEITDDCQVEVKFQVVMAGTRTAKIRPVGDTGDGWATAMTTDDENRIFGSATPAGQIGMLIKNKAAADKLKVGQAYYVDFTPAG